MFQLAGPGRLDTAGLNMLEGPAASSLNPRNRIASARADRSRDRSWFVAVRAAELVLLVLGLAGSKEKWAVGSARRLGGAFVRGAVGFGPSLRSRASSYLGGASSVRGAQLPASQGVILHEIFHVPSFRPAVGEDRGTRCGRRPLGRIAVRARGRLRHRRDLDRPAPRGRVTDPAGWARARRCSRSSTACSASTRPVARGAHRQSAPRGMSPTR